MREFFHVVSLEEALARAGGFGVLGWPVRYLLGGAESGRRPVPADGAEARR